ncbi:MAG TPA: hypothetical protein VMT37_02090 [Solirubrobacterales bacterium]|nr:hypothetical protein [Solirubrobacterales bacterium]
MPSAKSHRKPPLARSAAVAACLAAFAASAQGCSTTQEKAAAHQLEAEKILKARAKRQAERKHDKHSKSHHNGGKN